MFPPLEQQFHQHFVTSNEPSRYRRDRARQHPLPAHRGEPAQRDRRATGKQSGLAPSVKEGGDQIEYEDQDPRIHAIWLEEMRKNGVTPKLELPQKV